MRKKIISTIPFLLLIFFVGCSSCEETKKNSDEQDSLRILSELRLKDLNTYKQTIEMLNSTLDSIAVQEGMIFASEGDMPVTKLDVKHNLMRFEALLKKQGEKIQELEDKLLSSRDSTDKSVRLIEHLKKQVALKNFQIACLNAQLIKKDVDIKHLREFVESQQMKINSQSVLISELNKRNAKQGEVLEKQDKILNNGYVLIGSKSDLKRKGITKRGKLVANAVLDRTKFYKIDIRKWNEISFQAKRPRILTNMPSSSYELLTSGNHNFILRVINPSDFWRISKYLVIQTD